MGTAHSFLLSHLQRYPEQVLFDQPHPLVVVRPAGLSSSSWPSIIDTQPSGLPSRIDSVAKVSDPSRKPAPDNVPQPFHVYSMRQAIEEGFILDVLQNYTTHKLAFRLDVAFARRPDGALAVAVPGARHRRGSAASPRVD